MQAGIFTRRQLRTLLASACLVAGNSNADPLRFPDVQAYTPDRFKELTLEGAYSKRQDGSGAGGRLTLPAFAKRFALFGDFLATNKGERDGIAFGEPVDYSGEGKGGGVYVGGFPSWNNMTFALRISHNTQKAEVDSNIVVGGQQATVGLRSKETSVAVLISPLTPLFSNGANGYFSVGATQRSLSRITAVDGALENRLSERQKDTYPSLALGMSIPFGTIRLFGAVEYEEEASIAAGVRLNLNRVIKGGGLFPVKNESQRAEEREASQ